MAFFNNLLPISTDQHPFHGALAIVDFSHFHLPNPHLDTTITRWNDYLDHCGHAYGAKLDLFSDKQMEDFIFDTLTLTITTQFADFPPAEKALITLKNTYTHH